MGQGDASGGLQHTLLRYGWDGTLDRSNGQTQRAPNIASGFKDLRNLSRRAVLIATERL